MNIKLFNKIDKVGLDNFDDKYKVGEDITNPDGILVRSANLLEETFNPELLAIARAGAGVNNIPLDRCAKDGIVVFNTPGANANAVKELTICALLLASRKIIKGANWVKTLGEEDFSKVVEKGKSNFAGQEIAGKKLGVIGLGAIGANVANTAVDLGMEVYGYDPFISIKAAWNLNRAVKYITNLNELFSTVDFITIHVPSTKDTKGFVNEEAINLMKDDVKILNFARGDLINEEAILKGLESGKIGRYVTDFGSAKLAANDNVICLPHLGASTAESETNCTVMAVNELKDYLENGNIANSVNMPCISENWTTTHRVCVIHENIPNMLATFTTSIAAKKINIENLSNKARDNYAYTIIDTNDDVDADFIRQIKGVIKVRVLKK